MHVDFVDTPNAERAHACWEACEGIPVAALRQGIVKSLIIALKLCPQYIVCAYRDAQKDGADAAALKLAADDLEFVNAVLAMLEIKDVPPPENATSDDMQRQRNG